jgi:hypothetical protein
MPLARSKSFSVPDLAARIAVTLGALAIYRLGVALPLPGLDLERLYKIIGVVDADRGSVFALRVVPMITALLLVEIARLLSERFNDWVDATPANARRLNHWVVVGTLLLAAVQAYGVSVGFEGISGAVDDPGLEFWLTVVATLVGGTALLTWLAALISRHGVGSGLWVLLLAPYLAGLPATVLRYIEFVRMGVLSETGVASILAYALIAVASVAALGLVLARRGMPLERTLIWPLYISPIPVNFLTFVPLLFPDGPLRDTAGAFLSLGTPLHIAVLAAVIIVISLAQSRRAEPRSAAVGSSATPVDPAAAAPVALRADAHSAHLACHSACMHFSAVGDDTPPLHGRSRLSLLIPR